MRVAICTLGCKVNQYETQAMETLLRQRGHTLVNFDDRADAYVVNTCTVTAVSDRKSRQMIRRARTSNPAAVVAVCGCYPQTHPEGADDLDVDLVMGTNDRAGFVRRLEALAARRSAEPVKDIDNALRRRTFEVLPAGGLTGRTRAMLKVEDGCFNFCTYCIIPYARGPVRSLPLDEAVRQAAALAEAGYREIVLTGIELSSWGLDLDGAELTGLIEAVCQAAPGLRIRLGSLEPRTVTEDFCRRLGRLSNLCPHFHLSLQSGCDSVLKRMGRKYDTNRYRTSAALLRDTFGPQMGLTTDVIVGFPGETEAEFEASLAFLEEMAFSKVHVFPYSVRPGTPAAGMERQLTRQEKQSRARRAGRLAARLEGRFLQTLVGQTLPVLFEEEKDGLWLGHAPNYVSVAAQGAGLHNRIVPVTVTGLRGDTLLGQADPT